MTVPIDVGAGLIFLASVAVGYAVYRHTRATSTSTPPTGDLGTAFTAASATLVALAFLFGVSTPDTDQEPTPSPSQSQPATPPAPILTSGRAMSPAPNPTAWNGTANNRDDSP